MTEPYLCGNSCCFIKMVNKLIIVKSVVINVFRLQYPFQIKARGWSIFVLNPPSLFQCFLYIRISSITNEHLHTIINFVFPFPNCYICNVWEDDLLWIVSFKECFNVSFLWCPFLVFLLTLLFFCFLVFIFVIIVFWAFDLILLFLKFFQSWLILYFLKVLFCLLSCIFLKFLLLFLVFFNLK